MSVPPAATGILPNTAATDPVRGDAETRLSGWPLALARAMWGVVTLALVTLDALGIPATYAHLLMACVPGRACVYYALTPQQWQSLHALGLSPSFYAAYIVTLECLTTLVFVMVAAVIFWRRSDSRVALISAFALVAFGASFGGPSTGGTMSALPLVSAVWTVPVEASRILGNASFAALFYLFPSGQWVPRWAPWLVAASLTQNIMQEFLPASPLSQPNVLGGLVFFGLAGSLVVAQIYRYRYVSTPAERQQTRWVVFGVAVGAGGFLLLITLYSAFTPPASLRGTVGVLIGATASSLLILLVPLSIALAILRSRLFDIDVIIRRTLIYGTLSVVLAAVYVGAVIGAQVVAQAMTGLRSVPDWLIVATTLLIAALFNPLRLRLQRGIDRRFFRRKYDAARTLASFGSALRAETDLAEVSARLLAVIQETMQPEHVSLWLRPAARGMPRDPDRAPRQDGAARAARQEPSHRAR